MALSLQLVNETTLPDGGPISFRITGKRGIDIGRDAHLDWTLPDPTRYISSKHCEIRYKDGGYWLHDVSTNGTLLNGASQRMAAPHRLRTGDRFAVGHYLVAVTVEGEDGAPEPGPAVARPMPPEAANYQQLWVNAEEVPPPIDPRQLRASRLNAPVHSDFLDWAADVPNPFQASAPSYPAPPKPPPAPPLGADMDWAVGPPSHIPVPPPPPPPMPAPRRPGADAKVDVSWGDIPAVVAAAEPAGGAAAPKLAPPAFAPEAALPPEAFVRQVARAAGLPEDVLMRRDPGELAEQIGAVLRLVAENLMQLLNARLQAKRLARSSSHTTIQAIDNNPLKFCPSAQDAMRIMFGPATGSYLDANRALGQGFDDLKAHQVKTYSAMQHAITKLMADLDPLAIEQANDQGRGLAGLLVSRKAKLWDDYEARWGARIGRESSGLIDAFMRHFAECYDRDGV
jgi:type VI secretion system protein ImpI